MPPSVLDLVATTSRDSAAKEKFADRKPQKVGSSIYHRLKHFLRNKKFSNSSATPNLPIDCAQRHSVQLCSVHLSHYTNTTFLRLRELRAKRSHEDFSQRRHSRHFFFSASQPRHFKLPFRTEVLHVTPSQLHWHHNLRPRTLRPICHHFKNWHAASISQSAPFFHCAHHHQMTRPPHPPILRQDLRHQSRKIS